MRIRTCRQSGRRGPSRTFLCTLIGLLMTVIGRLGPWSWPLWPANSLLDLYLARVQPSVVSPDMKVLGLFVLLFVNVAFWASIAGVVWAVFDRLRRPSQRFRSMR